MKKTSVTALLAISALTALAAEAQAADDNPSFTGGVALTSDYRFRGISQSDRSAAVQGFVQVDYNNFYFNAWASSIDFNDVQTLTTFDETSVELDLTLGYNHAFSDDTTGGLKAIFYTYPDADYRPGVNHYD